MRKLLSILILSIFTLTLSAQDRSATMHVTDNVTNFNANLRFGSLVFDESTNELWKITQVAGPSDNISSVSKELVNEKTDPFESGIYSGSSFVPFGTTPILSDYINFSQGEFGVGIVPSSKLHIKGDDLSTAFRVDADNINNLIVAKEDLQGLGFVGINTPNRIQGATLSVSGNTATTGVMSLGGAPIIGNSLVVPANWRLLVVGGASFGVELNTCIVKSNPNNIISFRNTSNLVYGELSTNNFLIKSVNASTGTLISDESLNISSSYWDGNISQDKLSTITHNITDANSGSSQLDLSIEGDNIISALDDGRVGVGTSLPDESSIFEISSANRGFLPPRMTTAQRDVIINPANGLQIYNTSTNRMQHWNGNAWRNM